MKKTNSFNPGKYRDLLLAICLFIVLDLGILVFNYQASVLLERDTARIQSAGELRMLTQQLTKSLLTLQAERVGGMPTQTSMAQLSQAHEGFGKALASLKASLDRDAEFSVFGLRAADVGDAVERVEKEWRPLSETIAPVLAVAEPSAQDIEIASTKAVARNIKLAVLAEDVANAVEAAARAKTLRMRQIQLGAIALALLNFVYIVFKFLRRLHASDLVAEEARRETEDILNTVSEGLLLVRPDGTVGTQFSASVPNLLMHKVRAGDDFARLLRLMLDESRAEEAGNFLRLLFDPKVKPGLLRQLDPLREVEVRPPQGGKPRYLTFRFTQVRQGDAVKELLVTVVDVTQRIELERELAAVQDAARGGIDDLVRVLESEPALLHDFLANANAKLGALNRACREAGRRPRDYQRLVDDASRTIHGIKGEAAALGLDLVARQAHRMEDALAPLRGSRTLAGEDLIPVVFELSKVQEQVERLHKLFTRLSPAQVDAPPQSMVGAMVRNLESLSRRVAESVSKQVRLTSDIRAEGLPPAVARVLSEALPQLVRNAVVHGIETPQERESQGKPPVGELRLEITPQEDGRLEVVLSDDGRGIHVEQVRERALALRSDAVALSDSQALAMIFHPNFSTSAEVTEHAGRGDGLALVRQLVEHAGARLRVMTQPRAYTRFVMNFQPE
ncbi:MAG TPA: ATP-binding protein [Ramlibacter sp.]|nr:ATP-binding protein [Ramlibacter sp.]